jgi:CBS domain-containing protein
MKMKVRDIMTPNPRTAELDTTLEEIAILMKEEDVGAIPVMEDGRVSGVVTDRDIVLRCIAEGKDPTECTAEDVMTESVRTIGPDADIDEAADMMAEAQIRRLAVVQKHRLVGMISLGDIAVKAGDQEEETTAETLEEVSKGVKGQRGQQASGRNQRQEQGQEFEEESEFEMAGSGARPQRGGDPNRSAFREAESADRARSDRSASRANWNQGDREVQRRGEDTRRVASARDWEGGRAQDRDREEGRMQQRTAGRGSQQPGVRGRDQQRAESRGRVQQTGETRRTSERGRPEKVGHGTQGVSQRRAPQGAQGISNRAAGRENARQAKVAPKRADAGGNRNARRRAS